MSESRELFKRELFGVDEPLRRVVDYFKAAAAGSDVGRRLLLLLGPPSGGKSTLAILLNGPSRNTAARTTGALCHQRLTAARIAAERHSDQPALGVRNAFGVSISGEISPWAAITSTASARAIICASRWRESSCRRPRVAESARTLRMIPPRPISRIW